MDLAWTVALQVAFAVVSIVVMLVRGRRAEHRRQDLAVGAGFRCRAVLAAGPGRFRKGTLRMTRDDVTWYSRRTAVPVHLTGAAVLSVDVQPRVRPARPDDVLLRLAHPDGYRLRLLLQVKDATTVTDRLRGEPRRAGLVPAGVIMGDSRRDGLQSSPRWPWAVLGLAAVWFLGCSWLWWGGHPAVATVMSGDGAGLCTVAWTDDGIRHTATVDCADEPAGTPRTVQVLAPPVTGEAMDPGTTQVLVPVIGTVPLGAGLLGLATDAVRRRRDRGLDGTRPGAVVAARYPADARSAPVTVAQLTPSEHLPVRDHLAALAPHARRQVPDDGWEDPRRPDGATAPARSIPPWRQFIGPAVALLILGGLTTPSAYCWLVMHAGDTLTATATAGRRFDDDHVPLLPDTLTVTFRDARGTGHAADVAGLGTLPPGPTIVISYAVDDPGQARLVGAHDGLTRGAGATAIGLLLIAGWVAWRALGVRQDRRALAQAAAGPPHPVLGLLTADPEGDPTLILCHPSMVPPQLYAIAIRPPLPHGTAAAFASSSPQRLRIRGQLAEGEQVMVDLPDLQTGTTTRTATVTLLPCGVAWRPDVEDLRVLLDSVAALHPDHPLPTDPTG